MEKHGLFAHMVTWEISNFYFPIPPPMPDYPVYVQMDVQFFFKTQIAGPWKGKECWKKGDVEPKEGQPRALIVLEHLDQSHLLFLLLGYS